MVCYVIDIMLLSSVFMSMVCCVVFVFVKMLCRCVWVVFFVMLVVVVVLLSVSLLISSSVILVFIGVSWNSWCSMLCDVCGDVVGLWMNIVMVG